MTPYPTLQTVGEGTVSLDRAGAMGYNERGNTIDRGGSGVTGTYKEKARLMDEAAMDRAITRLSHEILEKNNGAEGVVLIGIRRRGYPLAERIAAKIRQIEGVSVPVGEMDITFYRDDLSHGSDQPILSKTEIPFPVDGKTVVLVDDVIFTGRTVRSALDGLFDLGRPGAVRLAVMIDRGLRELPFRPDFVGKNIPTSHSEMIRVKVKEYDGEDSVTILQKVTEGDLK